jgi:hypothetical protein
MFPNQFTIDYECSTKREAKVKMLKSIVDSKILRLLVALILAITSGVEVFQSIGDVGAHHGVMLFAMYQILQAMAGMFGAFEYAISE